MQGLASFAIANYLDDREDKKKEKAARDGKTGESGRTNRLNLLAMRGCGFGGRRFRGDDCLCRRERTRSGRRDLKKDENGDLCQSRPLAEEIVRQAFLEPEVIATSIVTLNGTSPVNEKVSMPGSAAK